MLSQLFAKRGAAALLSRRITGVRYFSLNKQLLQDVNQKPLQIDWNNYFKSFPSSDVAGSDVDSITQLLRSLSFASESEAAN